MKFIIIHTFADLGSEPIVNPENRLVREAIQLTLHNLTKITGFTINEIQNITKNGIIEINNENLKNISNNNKTSNRNKNNKTNEIMSVTSMFEGLLMIENDRSKIEKIENKNILMKSQVLVNKTIKMKILESNFMGDICDNSKLTAI